MLHRGMFHSFGEPQVRARGREVHRCENYPEDRVTGYFELRLRYAPRDYLQAQNLIFRESPQALNEVWM